MLIAQRLVVTGALMLITFSANLYVAEYKKTVLFATGKTSVLFLLLCLVKLMIIMPPLLQMLLG
jgi:hypothetical protein